MNNYVKTYQVVYLNAHSLFFANNISMKLLKINKYGHLKKDEDICKQLHANNFNNLDKMNKVSKRKIEYYWSSLKKRKYITNIF